MKIKMECKSLSDATCQTDVLINNGLLSARKGRKYPFDRLNGEPRPQLTCYEAESATSHTDLSRCGL